MIPRLAVATFVWDCDGFVGYSDGVVEVGFDFSTGPFGKLDGELPAKCIVDGVDGFDDERIIRSSIFWVLPQTLHCKICNVSGIGLRFMSESSPHSGSVVRTAEEFPNVTGGAGKRASVFELVFDIILIGVDSIIAFKVKGLDYFTFLRRDEHDGELFAVGEVLFEEVLGHLVRLHVVVTAVLDNFTNAVEGFGERGCFNEGFNFGSAKLINRLSNLWEFAFAL